MKIAVFLASLLLASGGYLALRHDSAQVLRESAAGILAWEASQGKSRFITIAEIEQFPKPAAEMIFSACFAEGGNPWRTRSCYKDASSWMREVAREHEEKRELGLALLGVGALVGVSAFLVARRERRQRALLE